MSQATLTPITVENYRPPSVAASLRLPAARTAPAEAPALDTFKDLGGGRAECCSKNGPLYAMRYAVFAGGRKVTSCKCKGWEFDAGCRHGEQLQARLDAQDAAECLLLAEHPNVRHIRSSVQDAPCAACRGLVVSAMVWGRWPLPGAGEVLAYWPYAKIVCGCGIKDGGSLR